MHYLVLAVKGQGETSISTQNPGSGHISVEERLDGIVELRDLDVVVVGISKCLHGYMPALAFFMLI